MYADTSKKSFIGLFGEWSSGKSSILRTVKGRLESNQETTYKFIQYDAWKYTGNSFRRIFLLELQQQLHVKAFDKFFRFYDNINEDTEVKQITNNATLLLWHYLLLLYYSYWEFRVPAE